MNREARFGAQEVQQLFKCTKKGGKPCTASSGLAKNCGTPGANNHCLGVAEHSGDPEEKIEKNIAHFDCIIYNQVAEHSGDPGGSNLEVCCSDGL